MQIILFVEMQILLGGVQLILTLQILSVSVLRQYSFTTINVQYFNFLLNSSLNFSSTSCWFPYQVMN